MTFQCFDYERALYLMKAIPGMRRVHLNRYLHLLRVIIKTLAHSYHGDDTSLPHGSFCFCFCFFVNKLSCFEYNEDVTPFKLNSNQSAELIKTSSCLVSSVTEHCIFDLTIVFN